MSEVYQKLKKIVSERFVSNDLNMRHAYSRNVDPVLHGISETL